jgi:hypothetical protein
MSQQVVSTFRGDFLTSAELSWNSTAFGTVSAASRTNFGKTAMSSVAVFKNGVSAVVNAP